MTGGPRGPAPQPTALKMLRGNPGKQKLNKREPVPRRARIMTPGYLTVPEREIFARLRRELTSMDPPILTVADVDMLAMLSKNLALTIKADIKMQTGIVVGKNRMDISPWMKIKREAEKAAMGQLAHFGLSPSSRSRLQVGSDGKGLQPSGGLQKPTVVVPFGKREKE